MWRVVVCGAVVVVARAAVACPPELMTPQGTCRDRENTTISPEKPTRVEVTTSPAGAEVRSPTGALVGVGAFVLTPADIKKYGAKLVARLYDHEDEHVDVTPIRGRVIKVTVKLRPFPILKFTDATEAARGAIVFLEDTRTRNERSIGAVPIDRYAVPPGKYRVVVRKDFHQDWNGGEIDLPSGATPPPIAVPLVAAKGHLLVKLRGFTARGELYRQVGSRPAATLGPTPEKKFEVDAGPQVLEIRFSPTLKLQSDPIELPVGETRTVTIESPTLRAPVQDDSVPIDFDRAISACRTENEDGAGCIVAGHEANVRNDRALAERMYKEGCYKRGNAFACYALGYLLLEKPEQTSKRDANVAFAKACTAPKGEPDACWAQYLAQAAIPKVTDDSGDRMRFRVDEPSFDDLDGLDGHVMGWDTGIGFGPYRGTPSHAEIGIFGDFNINQRFKVGVKTGVRLRYVRSYEETGDARSNSFGGGPHFDLGFGVRPFRSSDFAIHVKAALTTYLPSDAGVAFHLFGRTYLGTKGVLSFGVALDRAPLQFASVTAFGETQEVTRDLWRPVITLLYGRVLERSR